MKIDPTIVAGSRLPSLTNPSNVAGPKKEEWIGDAVLSLGLRHFVCTVPPESPFSTNQIGVLARSISFVASNDFLNTYSQWLKIEGGANEVERRMARLFLLHGFEEVKLECQRMFNAWADWRGC